eukprot:m.562552 g.562552  ORF g.562552 m.562552 type:complete len:105 (-) comp22223_c0_seq13:239-553(-)
MRINPKTITVTVTVALLGALNNKRKALLSADGECVVRGVVPALPSLVNEDCAGCPTSLSLLRRGLSVACDGRRGDPGAGLLAHRPSEGSNMILDYPASGHTAAC